MQNVLVVEDDVDFNAAIVAEIETAGFSTIAAHSIDDAERAFSPPGEISAVVLDIRLPDGDGRALCARLRDAGNSIPVILMSGLDGEDDIVEGLDIGADAYVVKPFASSELVARLRHLLRSDEPERLS
jgi:DNA-binding response OmpR family regulator